MRLLVVVPIHLMFVLNNILVYINGIYKLSEKKKLLKLMYKSEKPKTKNTTSGRTGGETKKAVSSDRSSKKTDEKKTRGNNSQAKSSKGRKGMEQRLTDAQMKRLKEHAKMHKGGMASKHMKKMMMVMTKEGKSFSEAHKIAVNHDQMKKK